MKQASILAITLLTVATTIASFLSREADASFLPREKTEQPTRVKRYALLIGNTDYAPEVVPLSNPVKDIRLIEKSLTQIGFDQKQIKRVENGTRIEILSAIDEYADRLAAAGKDTVGFFYYSGHGIALEDDGRNYLIPIDVTRMDRKVRYNAIPLQEVVDRLSQVAPKAAHFVIFDACRNVLNTRTRGSKGFRAVRSKTGMLIAFSTEPGQTASDVGEASGPYAAALARNIVKPGLSHLDVFQNVKEGVLASTDNQQLAWTRNGLIRRVYLSSQIKTDNKTDNRWAILIGASDSSKTKPSIPSIPSVPGAQTDVEDTEALLSRRFGFQKNRILKLVGQDATGQAIENAFKGIERKAKRGDHLFVLLAGHASDGETLIRLSGRNIESTQKAKLETKLFFIPADANFRQMQEVLSGDFITSYIKSFTEKGVRVTAIFDTAQGLVNQPIPNAAVYAAPDAVESIDIYNGTSKMRGAFTNFVLTGLEGRADKNGDGMMTYRELRAHLTKKYFENEKAITFRGNTRSPGGGTKAGLFLGQDKVLDKAILQPVKQ